MFRTFMNRYGTPLTTGFFLISAITGVALFFHWGPGAFHPMHEWLSMVLLVPFALHLIKNWTSLVNYARRGTLYIPLLVALASTAYFFLPQSSSGHAGNKQVAFMLVPLVTQAPLSQVAPIAHMDGGMLVHKLSAHGLTVTSEDQSIAQIAEANGKNTNDVLAMAFQSGGHGHQHGPSEHDHHDEH